MRVVKSLFLLFFIIIMKSEIVVAQDIHGIVPLPLASGGILNEGFTGTGLSRFSDGRWLVGNDGRSIEGDISYESSVVILSADGRTKLAEFKADTFVSNAQSVQGVVALADNSFWFTVKQQQRLVHLDEFGKHVETISLDFRPNGLGYDNYKNALIVADDDGLVRWVSLENHNIIMTRQLLSGLDQLFMDKSRGTAGYLWTTEGLNKKDGILRAYNIASKTYLPLREKRWLSWYTDDHMHIPLSGSRAIEGVVVKNENVYVLNNAYFHGKQKGGNNIRKYNFKFPFKKEILTGSTK
jgi:hypothetical protein